MVWKAVRIVLLVGLVALSAAMVWQHDRYLDARRHVVQDYQDPWHGEVFHVLTYLTVEDDAALITRLRLLNRTAREEGSSQLIYAGKVIHDGLVSPQIAEALGGQVAWNGIVLQQFEDRAAYDDYRADPAVKAALAEFPVSFAVGMRRSATINLAMHQGLLFAKIARTLMFTPDVFPLEDAVPRPGGGFTDIEQPLLAAADGLAKNAIMIVNLRLSGDEAQQAADAKYAASMLGLMAERGYGPMHIGDPVAIDHALDYDLITMVYYPGSGYFRDLLFSSWYQGIFGNKQLADAQSSITAPMAPPAGLNWQSHCSDPLINSGST